MKLKWKKLYRYMSISIISDFRCVSHLSPTHSPRFSLVCGGQWAEIEMTDALTAYKLSIHFYWSWSNESIRAFNEQVQ